MAKSKALAESRESPAPAAVMERRSEPPEKLAAPRRAMERRSRSPLPPPNGGPPADVSADILTFPGYGPGETRRARMSRAMQKTVGNARVSRMVDGTIQAKLAVGAPGDRYEQEADEAASRVVSGQKVARISRIAAGGVYSPVYCQKPGEEDVQMRHVRHRPETSVKTDRIRRQAEEEEELQTSPVVQQTLKEELQAQRQAEEAFEEKEESRQEPTGAELDTAKGVQTKAEPDRAGAIEEAGTELRIKSPGGGHPLPEGIRAEMEARLGADFSAVNVHDTVADREDAGRLNAKAFTYRDHIWLGPGASAGDRKLMAHELTHVLQQGAGMAHRAPARIQLTPQRRSSLDTEWYVEMEPATSIVPVSTEVTFRLKNSANVHYAAWETVNGENRPIIGVRVRGGPTRTWVPSSARYPMTLRRTFNRPGHVEVFFQGRPLRGVGPPGQPGAMTIRGNEIYVSVELDITQHLTRAAVEAEPSRATNTEDINRIEDPNASEPEIAEAFKRIAVRRGIDIVNQNKQEAWDLLQMYTQGASGRTPNEAMQELQRVLGLYSQLGQQIYRLRSIPREGLRVARQAGVEIRGREQLRNFVLGKIRDINLVRASLIDAFPAMALSVGGGPRATLVRRGRMDQALPALQSLLRQVLTDCDSTRRGLATEDLHIFDVTRVVTEVRQSIGIDADPRRRRAVDAAIRQHRRSALAQSLGLAGAAIVLLFVPGLGPYLAAAAGLVAAGLGWERAGDLLAAAGAGVREGIVSEGEAGAAVFWASIETLLAGLDVVAAVRPLIRIAPHVAAATDRVVPAASRAGGRAAPRALEGPLSSEAAGAILRSRNIWQMSAEHLNQFFQRLMRRALRVSREELHFYDNMDDFVSAIRTVYRRAGEEISPERVRQLHGLFDPINGHIHISPRGGLATLIHESLHRYARETFSWGRQLTGNFLHEGIVESITRHLIGPSSRSGYNANVRFVRSLESRFGRSTIWNVLLERNGYAQLRLAVRRALGGDDMLTHFFFNNVRRGDRESIRQALEMLERTTPRGG